MLYKVFCHQAFSLAAAFHVIRVRLPSQSAPGKHNKKSPQSFAHLMNYSTNVSAMFGNHKIVILTNLSHTLAAWTVFHAQFMWSRHTTCAKDHGLFLSYPYKAQQPIKYKLLLSMYSQIYVVQYGEFGRWSLVGVKVCLTTNSPNTVHTFCSGQVGRIEKVIKWVKHKDNKVHKHGSLLGWKSPEVYLLSESCCVVSMCQPTRMSTESWKWNTNMEG